MLRGLCLGHCVVHKHLVLAKETEDSELPRDKRLRVSQQQVCFIRIRVPLSSQCLHDRSDAAVLHERPDVLDTQLAV